MKKPACFIILNFLTLPFSLTLLAQEPIDSIRENDVSAILNFLSSDNLKGRGNFTPELVDAGKFIANRFKDLGLQPFPGSLNYFQPFNAGKTKAIYRDNVVWNGKNLDQSSFFYLTSEMIPQSESLKNFRLVEYDGQFNDSIYLTHWLDTTNTLVWLKDPQPRDWQSLIEKFRDPGFPPTKKILFVEDRTAPSSLVIETNSDYRKNVLFDIVGVLPGKTKPNEVIIFSAHYDHLGSTPSLDDGIYNGANDDASGTTALLELAKYFALKNDNARTIFFCAFAGEELGLLGSSFLTARFNPERIVTMVNIEMIGKTKNDRKNFFFLTGERYSTLGKILKAHLENSPVVMGRDPDDQDLFQRSDNFPFALKGVPAHSIMCSDDGDPCYHQTCDEAKDIDIANMTRIIKAIALSTSTIVSGDDTPSRISTGKLSHLTGNE